MAWYCQHDSTHLEIRVYFGYIWFHRSGGQGDRYKTTRVLLLLDALRLLLDIQASIEMIVERRNVRACNDCESRTMRRDGWKNIY